MARKSDTSRVAGNKKKRQLAPVKRRVKSQRSRIFISYRREDSASLAQHLFESLATIFGRESVFFDQSTIEPGARFPKRIATAVASSAVMLVIIGQHWFTSADGADKPRIHDPHDWVRRELEVALKRRAMLIPVLVDGATMPKKSDLPASLSAISTRQAIEIPWHESIAKLSQLISKATDASARYDLTSRLGERIRRSASRDPVLVAMEISLARRGENVTLDGDDLRRKFEKLTSRPLSQGTTMSEIMYVVDRLGISGRTARGDNRVYSARVYRLKSRAQIPPQLAMGRPVLAGINVTPAWFEHDAVKSGVIEDSDRTDLRGGIVAAIVGFDPGDGSYRFLTHFGENWGRHGIGTLTAAAAKRFMTVEDYLYAVEADELIALKSLTPSGSS